MNFIPDNFMKEPTSKEVVWTIEEGISYVRKVEDHLRDQGFHAALSGGVLWKGSSTKDLDIILYPHTSDGSPFLEGLEPLMSGLIDVPWRAVDHEEYGDSKRVMKGTVGGKIVDFFLLQ